MLSPTSTPTSLNLNSIFFDPNDSQGLSLINWETGAAQKNVNGFDELNNYFDLDFLFEDPADTSDETLSSLLNELSMLETLIELLEGLNILPTPQIPDQNSMWALPNPIEDNAPLDMNEISMFLDNPNYQEMLANPSYHIGTRYLKAILDLVDLPSDMKTKIAFDRAAASDTNGNANHLSKQEATMMLNSLGLSADENLIEELFPTPTVEIDYNDFIHIVERKGLQNTVIEAVQAMINSMDAKNEPYLNGINTEFSAILGNMLKVISTQNDGKLERHELENVFFQQPETPITPPQSQSFYVHDLTHTGSLDNKSAEVNALSDHFEKLVDPTNDKINMTYRTHSGNVEHELKVNMSQIKPELSSMIDYFSKYQHMNHYNNYDRSQFFKNLALMSGDPNQLEPSDLVYIMNTDGTIDYEAAWFFGIGYEEDYNNTMSIGNSKEISPEMMQHFYRQATQDKVKYFPFTAIGSNEYYINSILLHPINDLMDPPILKNNQNLNSPNTIITPTQQNNEIIDFMALFNQIIDK